MENELIEVLEISPDEYAAIEIAEDFTLSNGIIIQKGTRLTEIFPAGIIWPLI